VRVTRDCSSTNMSPNLAGARERGGRGREGVRFLACVSRHSLRQSGYPYPHRWCLSSSLFCTCSVSLPPLSLSLRRADLAQMYAITCAASRLSSKCSWPGVPAASTPPAAPPEGLAPTAADVVGTCTGGCEAGGGGGGGVGGEAVAMGAVDGGGEETGLLGPRGWPSRQVMRGAMS